MRRAGKLLLAVTVILTVYSMGFLSTDAAAAKKPPKPHPMGTITVINSLVPSGASGRFDFKIGSVTFDNNGNGYGDQESTGAYTVTTGRTSVSEAAHAGTTATDYGSHYVCTRDGAPYLSGIGTSVRGGVSVGKADAIVCTFTNTRVTMVENDCSAGYVAFTFDDGPSANTPLMIQTLEDLNLYGTFFVNGVNIDSEAARLAIRNAVAAGFTIGNHTYNHLSFTGLSTGTAPLTAEQVTAELESASAAIVEAGAPRPTLYRPAYGDINAYYDLLARNLGYRIVMSYGTAPASSAGDGNIVDSHDWTGISPEQIASNVTVGYTDAKGYFFPGIKADSIVSMHDGAGPEALNTIAALPLIVEYMNANHLCSTATIRPDATGNIVPPPAPPVPTSGNLVTNPDLEQVRAPGTPAAEPVCFQHAGYGTRTSTWTLTSDAHSGAVAQRVDVTSWTSGDDKLVVSQRTSEQACLAAVTPGASYSMWVWYKGDWTFMGTSATAVSITTFYRDALGTWSYWQASPWFPPTFAWNLAYFKTAPLPPGATAISWGLAIKGVGNLTTDDYTMVVN